MPSKLAVLISDNSDLLQTLLDAIRAKYLDAEIAVIVTNRKAAPGLRLVRSAQIPTVYHPLKPYLEDERGRQAYDADLAALITKYQPEWIILAGWMHVLSAAFLQRFPYRVVNLHWAAPGKFPGAHAITEAYEAFRRGEIKQTGVTVHLVTDERVNRGTVLALEDVPLYRTDTLNMVTQRIQRAGRQLLVNALHRLIQGDEE